jgi:hypothetical protein
LKGGLNGAAIKNFDRMLKSKPGKSFWAFRQHPKALPFILDMQKGDKLIYIFGKAGKSMAMPLSPKTEVVIYRYYICNIVEPYYMVLDNQRGLFFEDTQTTPGINNRKWPHFVDFDIKKKCKNTLGLEFGKQADFAKAFSNSFNHGGGTPYPISRAQYEKLKDHLNKINKQLPKIIN